MTVFNDKGDDIVAIVGNEEGGGLIQAFNKNNYIGLNMAALDAGGAVWTFNEMGEVRTAMMTGEFGSGIWSYYGDGSTATSMGAIFGSAIMGTHYENAELGSFMTTYGETSEITIENKQMKELINYF